MKDILSLPRKEMLAHINELAEDYLKLTGRRVCKSCAADVNFMLTTLKTHYKMTNFQLKKTNAIYKLQIGSARTISNNVMTDELAIEFLSIRKERIDVFSKYPENWEELVDGKVKEPVVALTETVTDESEDDILREQLGEYKMSELRDMYPDIKATSKADFIEKVIND